jgi:hypothetical protein
VLVIEHNLEVIKTADWSLTWAPRAATPAAAWWPPATSTSFAVFLAI